MEIALVERLIAAAALVLLPASLLGQAKPAVLGGIPPLTAGGYYSNFDSDYSKDRLGGLGVYVDWGLFGKLGVEGEARWLRFHQDFGTHEDNYLVGPRYSFRHRKFVPYAKFLLGAGELNFPNGEGHGGYFALVPGGGLDYRLTRRFTVRGDYEYHFWPSAPGGGLPTHGLTPNGFTIGVGYRIFK
jgi:opacity protein-like surface antigen